MVLYAALVSVLSRQVLLSRISTDRPEVLLLVVLMVEGSLSGGWCPNRAPERQGRHPADQAGHVMATVSAATHRAGPDGSVGHRDGGLQQRQQVDVQPCRQRTSAGRRARLRPDYGTLCAVHLTRRQLLLLGAGVGAGAVLGVAATDDGLKLFDRLNPPHGVVPDGPTGPVVRGLLQSRARGRETRWAVAYPPGAEPDAALPVALVLHGRSGDSSQAFRSHALHRFLADAVRTGTPPFAMAAVDGGDHTYWHRRADGDDPQAMLLEDFLPLLAQRGLRTERFGLTGWSMGGYGALLLASRVPERVKAVAVDAAALWRRAADTPTGAFDGVEDFAAHDVLGHLDRLRGLPLRVGCGASDPFNATSRALVSALPQAERAFPRGGHEIGCWNLLRPGDVRFLGHHLAAS